MGFNPREAKGAVRAHIGQIRTDASVLVQKRDKLTKKIAEKTAALSALVPAFETFVSEFTASGKKPPKEWKKTLKRARKYLASNPS